MKIMSSKSNERESVKQKISELDEKRGKIFSKTGGWFPGKGVFSHGYSMLDDLVGKKSYFQILILNATGKMVDRGFADWVEAVYGCLSWPDPRIWCNQIGALAGSARASVLVGTAMGALATDSRAYGVFPLIEGLSFIKGALQQFRDGESVEDIVKKTTAAKGGKPYIVGYIRPIAKGDERLVVMERVAESLDMPEGEHLVLAYQIERVLLEEYDEGMNINGYVSAVLADHGFSAQEAYQMFAMLVSSGVTACYLDSYNRPSDEFLPQRCEDVDYKGVDERSI